LSHDPSSMYGSGKRCNTIHLSIIPSYFKMASPANTFLPGTYEVKKIVDRCDLHPKGSLPCSQNRCCYQVQWFGYESQEDNTWERRIHLQRSGGVKEMILHFDKAIKVEPSSTSPRGPKELLRKPSVKAARKKVPRDSEMKRKPDHKNEKKATCGDTHGVISSKLQCKKLQTTGAYYISNNLKLQGIYSRKRRRSDRQGTLKKKTKKVKSSNRSASITSLNQLSILILC
jgi:hypothetical protein